MIRSLVSSKFSLKLSHSCLQNCVKSIQIQSYFWSVFSCIRTEHGDFTPEISVFRADTGKYGPEITPYLDTFHAVQNSLKKKSFRSRCELVCTLFQMLGSSILYQYFIKSCVWWAQSTMLLISEAAIQRSSNEKLFRNMQQIYRRTTTPKFEFNKVVTLLKLHYQMVVLL